MITIIFVILGWVVCGLLAVFIGGLVDRFRSDGDDCPIIEIFFLGYIGLVLTFIALLIQILIYNYNFPNFNILNKIYSLGRGDK